MKLYISMCLSLLLPAAGAEGATIHVPANQPTIQAGIDTASDGDTVAVSSGVYSGAGNRDIDFKGKRILVRGVSAVTTIVDCGGTATEHHGGFVFRSTEDSSTVLSGFTIRNAWRPLPYTDSGAIDIRGDAAPVITQCAVVNNQSHGVVVAHYGRPDLINLQISHNSGYGVWMPGYPSYSHGVAITSCQVDHNDLGGLQVTMAMADRPNLIISNTIVENGKYGLFLEGEPPLTSLAVLDTVTIIEQNIIAFNQGFGIARGCCWFPGLHYYRNNVFGNSSGDLKFLGNLPDTVCMLSDDPLFCRQAGFSEYDLAAGSPCLVDNNLCRVHIGREIQGCISCCSGTRGNVDCDAAGNIDIADLSRLIDYLYISFYHLCCIEAANVDGSGSIDISDLSRLIDFLYISFGPPGNCS